MSVERYHDQYGIPRHLAYGLLPMVDWLIQQGIDHQPLLKQADIPEEVLQRPEDTISPQQENAFIQNFCRAANQPGLGLEIGSRYRLSKFGLLGLAAMTSPDVKTCLQVFMDYVALTWTYMKASIYTKNKLAFFQLEPFRELAESDDFIVDRDLRVSCQMISDALGKKLPLQRIEFRHGENGCKDMFETEFNCPVVFGAPYNRFCFAAHWLDEPLEQSDPAMTRIYSRQCQTASSSMYEESNYADRILRLLSSSDGAQLTLSAIARRMEVNPRTLQRKLAKENVMFQQLIDDFRLSKATELLCETQYTVEDISERLGYSDTAGFSNAFKRWVGVSPKAYRDNL